MNTTQMHAHVQQYLQLRRALGFKLAWPGHILPQFVDYLADTGSETITVEAAITWAGLRRDASAITLSHRLGAVRGFARYLASIDPATEIPPLGVFGKQQRRIPFIYSPEQIRLLVRRGRTVVSAAARGDFPGAARAAWRVRDARR